MHDIALGPADGATLSPAIDAMHSQARFAFVGATLHLALDSAVHAFDDVTYAPQRGSAQAAGASVTAPMSGRVLAVLVQAGDAVSKGQPLAVLEAMKMEHPLVAQRDGVVERVGVRPGDQVASRALIVTLIDAAG